MICWIYYHNCNVIIINFMNYFRTVRPKKTIIFIRTMELKRRTGKLMTFNWKCWSCCSSLAVCTGLFQLQSGSHYFRCHAMPPTPALGAASLTSEIHPPQPPAHRDLPRPAHQNLNYTNQGNISPSWELQQH